MMKIGQQLEAPKLHQKTLETPGIFTQSDRKVVTMDWLMFGFGSVRFNNWAIKSDATTKAMGLFFVLDPGSPKEGPGLWRRWGRSVFKRFPHRLTKLWNTMVWSHCFWLETHTKPGKRIGNTLQLVKLKDISFLDIQLSAKLENPHLKKSGDSFFVSPFRFQERIDKELKPVIQKTFQYHDKVTNLPTIWLAFHRAALEPMSFSRSGEILVSPMILISSKRLQKTLCSDELSYRVYAVDL